MSSISLVPLFNETSISSSRPRDVGEPRSVHSSLLFVLLISAQASGEHNARLALGRAPIQMTKQRGHGDHFCIWLPGPRGRGVRKEEDEMAAGRETRTQHRRDLPLELLMSCSMSSGYLVRRWATSRLHSGMPLRWRARTFQCEGVEVKDECGFAVALQLGCKWALPYKELACW